MEVINETTKLVAKALELLKLDVLYVDKEDQIVEAIKLLEEALDKLANKI